MKPETPCRVCSGTAATGAEFYSYRPDRCKRCLIVGVRAYQAKAKPKGVVKVPRAIKKRNVVIAKESHRHESYADPLLRVFCFSGVV